METDLRTSRRAHQSGEAAAKTPGHWLLASAGKRVLRPGGRELTRVLLQGLDIGERDEVVELAPGLGATTRLVLARSPTGYMGVERDEEAATEVGKLLVDSRHQCRVGMAHDTGLDPGSATVVFGEAFLTMQSDERKLRIVEEAHRILRPGGRFGIHELCLRPDGLDAGHQKLIRGELSRAIHVGARPLTAGDWRRLVEDAGFRVQQESSNEMRLLEPGRVVADEGLVRSGRFLIAVLGDRALRQGVRAMRRAFKGHARNLAAIALVATKP